MSADCLEQDALCRPVKLYFFDPQKHTIRMLLFFVGGVCATCHACRKLGTMFLMREVFAGRHAEQVGQPSGAYSTIAFLEA